MTSAAHARIPPAYKHSTAAHPPRPLPRDATSSSHVPDVTPVDSSTVSAGNISNAAGHTTPPSTYTADKVDPQLKSGASSAKSVKLRAHSRLASIGRLRSRGSTPQPPQRPQASQGETISAQVPVSPSDAGSQHKLSDTSASSKNSSATTLSDDAKSEEKPIEDTLSRPSFWLASGKVPGDAKKAQSDNLAVSEQYQRLTQHRPRMMHQTSSKLLRMTDDERPFTRVCTHTSPLCERSCYACQLNCVTCCNRLCFSCLALKRS